MPTYTKLVLPKGKRTSRIMRTWRAIWRDTNALINEFKVPLFLFLFVTIVGGWTYGELHVLAGKPRIPLIDLPYIIMALMILESPIDIPHEPYLIAFWYLMPPFAVYILGLGANEFIRLFFNRSERRDAWEEAVASTYRNHIIVLGVGHVGTGVIRTLVDMGLEVVAIDSKLTPQKDNEMSELGVPTIVGDGREPAILEKAGLAYADAFIASTSQDFINIEAIMCARELNPTIRIVARMWDNKFTNQLKNLMGVNAVISSSKQSAPLFAGAAVGIEITQTLTVHGKEYSMIRFTVETDSFWDGKTVDAIQKEEEIDVVLVVSQGVVNTRPKSDLIVRSGDTIVVFAGHDRITDLVARNRSKPNRKGLFRRK